MSRVSVIGAAFLSAAVAGCEAAESTQGGMMNDGNVGHRGVVASSATSSATSSRSEGVVSGENSRMSIAGDVVEVRHGEVRVNGISYGSVPSGSRVRYVVEGQKRQLFVDGQERGPQR